MITKNENQKIVQNVVYLLELLSFYSPLLKVKQIKYFKLYYENNWSYAEIAKLFKISRAAVCDSIMQTKKLLKKYESKLQLWKKHKKRLQFFEYINDTDLKNKLIQFEYKNLC